MTGDTTHNDETCPRCEGPKPDAGRVCPACEDLERSGLTGNHAPQSGHTDRRRTPPHGNTTR